jgi:hypothetical protein
MVLRVEVFQLARDAGSASFGRLRWADDEGFPANTDVELLGLATAGAALLQRQRS